MGQNVYLKKEPYELLETIQENLTDASQGDIMHRALEQFAEFRLDEKGPNQSDLFFPRFTIAAIPRVTIDKTTGDLNVPEEIGEWTAVFEEPRKGKTREAIVAYDKKSTRVGIIFENDKYRVSVVERSPDEDGENYYFNEMATAVSKLNSLLVPLSETPITPREYQVWWLTGEYSYEKTAELLDVSLETVRTHMTNLAAKRSEAEQTIGLLINQDYPYPRPKSGDSGL